MDNIDSGSNVVVAAARTASSNIFSSSTRNSEDQPCTCRGRRRVRACGRLGANRPRVCNQCTITPAISSVTTTTSCQLAGQLTSCRRSAILLMAKFMSHDTHC